jgi:hypothetical protein
MTKIFFGMPILAVENNKNRYPSYLATFNAEIMTPFFHTFVSDSLSFIHIFPKVDAKCHLVGGRVFGIVSARWREGLLSGRLDINILI